MRSLMYWIAITFALVGVLAVSACNTAKGLGEDFKQAGTAINNSATNVQKKLGGEERNYDTEQQNQQTYDGPAPADPNNDSDPNKNYPNNYNY